MLLTSGYSNGLLSGFFWAVNAILISNIYNESNIPEKIKAVVFLMVFIGFIHDLFSAITIYIFKVNKKNLYDNFKIKKHYLLIFSGCLAGPIGLTSYIETIKYLGVGAATSTVAIYPIVVAIILVVFFKANCNFRIVLAVIFTILGCVGVNFFSSEINLGVGNIPLGIIFALICIISWSFECIVVDRICNDRSLNSDSMLFIRQISSAFLYFIIICAFFDVKVLVLFFFEYKYLLLIFITSLFATLSYLAWYKAIDILGAPIATLLNVTYSFWGVILGVIILSQKINIGIVFSVILIMAGIVTLFLGNKKLQTIRGL